MLLVHLLLKHFLLLSLELFLLLHLSDNFDISVIIGVHDLVVMIGLVHYHGDCTRHEDVRAMVIVELVLNASKHTVLILIASFEIIAEQLLVELLLLNENLLLVTDNEVSGRDPGGHVHL